MGRFSLHPGCSNRKARQEELKLHSKSIEEGEVSESGEDSGGNTQ